MKTKAKAKITDPVKQMSRLVWPHYSPGLLLQDDDLTTGVVYTRELSRLMFRTLFGCGVMCGLVVRPEERCCKLHLVVDKCFALDCRGDPVYVPERQHITVDPCETDVPAELWVVLRRFDKCCAPRTAVCSPEDDEAASVCTRVRDGYEIRVLPERPECSCGCAGKDAAPEGPGTDSESEFSVYSDTTGAAKGQGTVKQEGDAGETGGANACKCVDPALDCYREHYAGECCECCDCEWIVLARVRNDGSKDEPNWIADHSVRRFVRPVLMRDPQVELESKPRPT
jgi:hypothetical protein